MAVETDLETLIEARHPLPEWATFRELANGTGGQLRGRIDVAAFNVWPSKKGHRVAYEVKRHRSDWLRELSQPDKRAWCEEHFTECYFVTDPGVVQEAELPDGWGLLVSTKAGDKLRRVRVARQREHGELPEKIMLAALRRAAEVAHVAQSRLVRVGDAELTAEVVEERLNHLVVEATRAASDRLKAEREELFKERYALRDARRLLEAPLEVLRDAVLGFQGRHEELTTEAVREWIRRACAGQVTDFRREVERLRHQCDRVLGEDSGAA